MSEAVLWAIKSAPIMNVNEYAVLSVVAEHADPDGCNSFPAWATIAERTQLHPRTVARTLRALEERGLIRKGNQAAAHVIRRADLRPVVYDVMIPSAWFKDIARINRERQRVGLPMLTRENRPALPPKPPTKPRRSDAGKKRKRGDSETPADPPSTADRSDGESPREMDSGGLSVTPFAGHGVTESPERGDSQYGSRGLEVTRPSPDPSPDLKTPESSSVVTVTVPGARVGDGEEEKGSWGPIVVNVEAMELLRRVPAPPGRQSMTETEMLELSPFVNRFLAEPWPWSKFELLDVLSAKLDDVKRLAPVLLDRLSKQLDPMRLPDDGGLWAHERPRVPERQVLVECVECRAPMPAVTHDGMCVGCRNTLLRALDGLSAEVRSQMDPVDLVDVDQADQLPGQLGVPVEFRQARESMRRGDGETSSPAAAPVE